MNPLVTLVMASHEGPVVCDVTVVGHPLDLDDPRRPGDIIFYDPEVGRDEVVRGLEAILHVLREARS